MRAVGDSLTTQFAGLKRGPTATSDRGGSVIPRVRPVHRPARPAHRDPGARRAAGRVRALRAQHGRPPRGSGPAATATRRPRRPPRPKPGTRSSPTACAGSLLSSRRRAPGGDRRGARGAAAPDRFHDGSGARRGDRDPQPHAPARGVARRATRASSPRWAWRRATRRRAAPIRRRRSPRRAGAGERPGNGAGVTAYDRRGPAVERSAVVRPLIDRRG
jgi:hypothetical protein